MPERAFIDAIGQAHTAIEQPPRIVSLVPSITELLCELGLSERLVGRTGFCIHPRAAVHAIAKVGGTKDVDLDKVRALQPTHVVVNIDENRRETAEALRSIAPNVIVTHPNAPYDNIALYRLLGGIFRCEASAQILVDRFEAALANCVDVARSFTPERVLYLIWRDPWMTVSRDTYIARTLALVGWESIDVPGTGRYPAITLEATRLDGTERVLLSSEPYRFGARHVTELNSMPALRGIPISLIDGEMTSWYGSRAIDGLAYLPGLRRSLSALG